MDKKFSIERLYQLDYDILQTFLYEAIFQPDPKNIIPFSIVEQPDLRKYIDNFGEQKGDYAIGVLDGDTIVGLVWVRLVKGYGHIDTNTPELNIAILKSYRGQKLGSILISD
ncbi:GNAT family N-acetyltransferase [Granulicatella seriolae]|uniref:GNAT family N-acetyltransferase n=1 Tax=Granulicatella seriolae TaxID=2967226 RepID=A0ABT1WJY5_9LACT|nr:GNAT family N-acetyltransferase [Granulicatella seriolae]